MISFEPIKFNLPEIPKFPDFEVPLSIKIPKPIEPLPPIIVGNPDIPKISVNWGGPKQISCCVQVCTHEEWLNQKEQSGMLWLNDKCEWIMRQIAKEVDITENFEGFIDDVYKTIKSNSSSVVPSPQEE